MLKSAIDAPRTFSSWAKQLEVERYSPVIIAILMTAAVVIRLMSSLALGFTAEAPGYEASNIAYSFATHGTIADAYYVGQGATAHLSPVSPMLAGWIEWLFVPRSFQANVALLCWAMLQTLGSYYLLYRLADKITGNRLMSLLGLALLCLSPVPLWLEVGEFRYWEGPLTVCLAAGLLILLVRYGDHRAIRPRVVIAIGAAIACTFFINPPVGLALGCCWALASVRRSWKECVTLCLSAAFVLGAITVPWGLRNLQTLGTFVPLRSNFGLELAIAYNDAALTKEDPGILLDHRLRAIHPAASGPGTRIEKRVGEVGYVQIWQDKTLRWISAHKNESLQLTVRHIGQFFLPPLWFFPTTHVYRVRVLFSMYAQMINILGMIALALGTIRGRPGAAYIGLFCLIVSLPYAIVQPVYRYSYLIMGIMTFAAAALMIEVAGRVLAGAREYRPTRVLRHRSPAPLAIRTPRLIPIRSRR